MRPSLLPGLLAAARRNLARGAEQRRACSRSAGAISATRERPTLGLVLAGERGAAPLAAAARRGRSTRSTPRPRRWRSSPPPARRSTISRCWATRRASIIPASRGGSALGPKNVLAEFGALHPRDAQGVRPRRAGRRRRDLPRRHPAEARRRRPHAQRLCAAAAAGGDARLRLPRAGGAGRRPAAARGARRRQGRDRRRRACSTSSPARACPRGRSRSRSRSTLQPGEKSFTDEELKAISDRIVAAAAKLGARLSRLRLRAPRSCARPSASRRAGASGSARPSPRGSARCWPRMLDRGERARARACSPGRAIRGSDALALRLCGGLHALVRDGTGVPELAALYPPAPLARGGDAGAAVAQTLVEHAGRSDPGSTARRRPTRSAARRC